MMNSKTADGTPLEGHGLAYPCDPAPEAGQAKEVAPGLWWIRMRLPFALNHINLWALRDKDDAGEGWALVDTGIGGAVTATAWQELFAGPLAGRITRVFITHMHPDHIGMAGWITRKFGCRIWISRLEYLSCRALISDTGREAPAHGGRDLRPDEEARVRPGRLQGRSCRREFHARSGARVTARLAMDAHRLGPGW